MVGKAKPQQANPSPLPPQTGMHPSTRATQSTATGAIAPALTPLQAFMDWETCHLTCNYWRPMSMSWQGSVNQTNHSSRLHNQAPHSQAQWTQGRNTLTNWILWDLLPWARVSLPYPKSSWNKSGQRSTYVDFSELPPARIVPRFRRLNEGHSSLLLQLQELERPRHVIPDFTTWAQCFAIYTTVLTRKHSERLLSLITYVSLGNCKKC